MEQPRITKNIATCVVALSMVGAAISAAPAVAHHNTCTWGVDVEASLAEGDPAVRYGPPLAMWGCHGPVVWATVVDGNGNETFVPVYGQRPAPRENTTQAPPASEPQPSARSPKRTKRAKRSCKTRRARSAGRAKARCRPRSRSGRTRR